ncbi:MAG: 2OG-Fe(II) oxygenase [Pseudomonadota bacterium]
MRINPEAVQVLDDLLPEPLKSTLIEAMSWMPVHFLNRRERYATHEFDMHWYYPLAFADEGDRADVEPALQGLSEELQCVAHCWAHLKASYPHPVRLYECMLSANAFGTEGNLHHDIAHPPARARHHTALVYCNARWEPAWAGETVVFDERGEIQAAVIPRPGRVIKIAGDPAHVGRAVSRTCPTDRRVLVFKLWEVDAPPGA